MYLNHSRSNSAREHGDVHFASLWVPALLVMVMALLAGALSIPFFGAIERSYASTNRIGAIASGMYTPVMSLAYLVTFGLVATRGKKAVEVVARRWELLLLLFVVVASVAWSVNMEVTARRTVALFGTTLVAIAISVLTSPRQAWKLLAVAFSLITVGSVAAAIIAPGVAIHHDIHEGAWRGLLSHKNNFGWLMATTLVVLAEGVRAHVFSVMPAALVALLALGCLVMSHSATALIGLIAAAGAITICTAFRKNRKIRLLVFIVGFSCAVAAALYANEISNAVLTLLGRTSTLSGRTALWTALQSAVMQRPLLGYGYDAFWASSISIVTLERGAFVTGHSHNGYLDLMLSMGVAGAVAYAIVALRATVTVYRVALQGDAYATVLFALLVLIHVVGMSGGVILDGNSIYWPIVVLGLLYRNSQSRTITGGIACCPAAPMHGARFSNLQR